jgi:predicted phage tail component-like protein
MIPVVTGISPNSGPATGGTDLTITGSGFTGASNIFFGDTDMPSGSFNLVSDTEITVSTPSVTLPSGVASSVVDVQVQTSAGTSAQTDADQFVFVATAITSVSPNAGPTDGGTEVTIAGYALTAVDFVYFGENTAATSFTIVSDSEITAVSPAGTGTVDIMLYTALGWSDTSSADQFTYGGIPSPVVTGISPTTGTAGTSVVISGSDFTGATEVDFGGTPTSFTFNSDSQITATAPTGTGAVDVTVTTASGTSAISSADQFDYAVAPSAPVLAYGFTFNGTYSKDMGIAFVSKDRVLLPNVQDQYISIPMRNGEIFFPGWLSDRLITLDCSLIWRDIPTLRQQTRKIAGWLYTLNRQTLTFDDEPGMIYIGKLYTQSGGSDLGGISLDQLPLMDNFSLSFRCVPLITSSEQHTLTGSGTAINAGTYNASVAISIAGPVTNPSLTINGVTVSWNGALASGQTLTIDTGMMTAVIGTANALGTLNGNFPQLAPGDNAIIADDNVTLTWNDTWI